MATGLVPSDSLVVAQFFIGLDVGVAPAHLPPVCLMESSEAGLAEALTPEDSARRILSIIASNGSRAGQGCPFHALQLKFLNLGGSRAELEAGSNYAGEHGWITNGPNNFVLLTDAGFGQA